MQLNKKALSLASGILPAAFWLIAMTISLLTGLGDETLTKIGSLHPRFSYSFGGALWIAIFHLIVGAAAGWLFAWLYNKFVK